MGVGLGAIVWDGCGALVAAQSAFLEGFLCVEVGEAVTFLFGLCFVANEEFSSFWMEF